MKKFITICITALSIVVITACKSGNNINGNAKVEGHYTYEHAFNYDLKGAHLDVHETGTMDFYPGGTALDSARQVYIATLQDSSIVTWVFNYVSPSKWRLEGEDFYFSGIKESFRMEVVEGDKENELAQEIIKVVSGSIDYEYLISANTPFSLRRVPQGRADVLSVDEKCGGAASGSAFC